MWSAKWQPFCLILNVLIPTEFIFNIMKLMSYLSYTINTMAADGLATQGARASATVVLISGLPGIFLSQQELMKRHDDETGEN